eukprot:1154363-Pelagomonas_calceolata.AAC.1
MRAAIAVCANASLRATMGISVHAQMRAAIADRTSANAWLMAAVALDGFQARHRLANACLGAMMKGCPC